MEKYCTICGNKAEQDAAFCSRCGMSFDKDTTRVIIVEKPPLPVNGMARAGIILSFFVPILGLIFSIIGLSKADEIGGSGKGAARAGLIISIIHLSLYLWIIILGVNG